jgi:hypothetical protein
MCMLNIYLEKISKNFFIVLGESRKSQDVVKGEPHHSRSVPKGYIAFLARINIAEKPFFILNTTN